jgi:hypothetical protein
MWLKQGKFLFAEPNILLKNLNTCKGSVGFQVVSAFGGNKAWRATRLTHMT